MVQEIKIHPKVFGNIRGSEQGFMTHLKNRLHLDEVDTVDKCDVIMAFVLIRSRAGTDIEAALKELKGSSHSRPAVLVAMHHTFNKDHVPPDSRLCVNQTLHAAESDFSKEMSFKSEAELSVFAVDCLFYEDAGLLKSDRNDRAVDAVVKHLTESFSIKDCNKKKKKQNNNEEQEPAPNNPSGDKVNKRELAPLKFWVNKNFSDDEWKTEMLTELQHHPQLQEVDTVEQCDVILDFVDSANKPADVLQSRNIGMKKNIPVVVFPISEDPVVALKTVTEQLMQLRAKNSIESNSKKKSGKSWKDFVTVKTIGITVGIVALTTLCIFWTIKCYN